MTQQTKCPHCDDTKQVYDQLHFKNVSCICQASDDSKKAYRDCIEHAERINMLIRSRNDANLDLT